MVGATTLSLFTVCQQWEQVGTILIMIIADRTSAPPCVHGKLWRGAPVVLKRLKGASRHQVMWKAGGRELWCGCCKSVAGMICVKGHVEADRDKGQAFRAEWASDCWLTRCLLFCFLNDAGSRPHCDLWWNGLSHLWASENSGAAGCFRESLSTSKAREVGCLSIFQTAWPWRKWGNAQL